MIARPHSPSAALLLSALAFAACQDKAGGESTAASAAASVAPAVSSSAPAASNEPPTECTDAECRVVNVSDKVKADLDAAHEKNPDLRIVMMKAATDENLKTLAKVPWVTQLKIESDKVADTFALLPLKQLKKLEIGPTNIKSLAGLTKTDGLVTFTAPGVDELTDVSALSFHPNLTEVVLSGTSITDIRGLQKATGLVHLDVAKTKVESLSSLEGHAKLETLDISETKVKELTGLSGDTALKTLVMTKTPVADLTPLKDAQALEVLKAGGTKVNDLAPLKGLKKLVTLDVSDAKVPDLKPLMDLTQLLEIDVSKNPSVNDLVPLVRFKKLKVLNLTKTHVKDVMALQGVTDLEELYLSGTFVNDLGAVARLKHLKKVVVPKWFPKKKIEDFKKVNTTAEVVVGTD